MNLDRRISAAEFRQAQIATKRKWRNQPCEVDGVRFDSKGEARRWEELRLLQLAGEISELRRQVRIPLIGQHDMPLLSDLDHQFELRVDFTYIRKGERHVTFADFKGKETEASKLKRAIVRAMYGRPVEVMR